MAKPRDQWDIDALFDDSTAYQPYDATSVNENLDGTADQRRYEELKSELKPKKKEKPLYDNIPSEKPTKVRNTPVKMQNKANYSTNSAKTKSNSETKSNPLGMLYGILFMLWFMGSFIALVSTAQAENEFKGAYIAIIMGQYFAVFGLLFYSSSVSNRFVTTKDVKTGFFPSIGVTVVVSALNYIKICKNGDEININSFIVYCLFSFFAVYAAITVIMCVKQLLILFLKHSAPVVGKCVQSGRITSRKGTALYSASYKYVYKDDFGKTFESMFHINKTSFEPKLGDEINLRINPKRPAECIRPFDALSSVPVIVSVVILFIMVMDMMSRVNIYL